MPNHQPPPKKPRLIARYKAWYARLSKKQKIWYIIGVSLLVAAILGGSAFALFHKEKPRPIATKKPAPASSVTPKPTTVAATLTGLQVDPAINEKPVTAVMIENSPDARPQSGLTQAGVVFEAVAEGGITRFLTLWQDTAPEYVGPVRSVRPYYVQWLMGFDAAVAHVGGSADALAMLKQKGAKDLDQFFNPSAYWRVNTRYAPHNMYTSIPKLQELEAQKGFGKSNYTGFARKKESAITTPTAGRIDVAISGALYNSHYDYEKATNTYLRSEGGKPHVDEKSGTQIAPKVVIALVIPKGQNGIYTTYQTLGSGKVIVFQDGGVTEGTWHKTANASNFTFTDANNAPLALNPGQTWLTAVGDAANVTFAP